MKIKVAIAGKGNCASAVTQGVEYHKNAKENSEVPVLLHVSFGGLSLSRCKVCGGLPPHN